MGRRKPVQSGEVFPSADSPPPTLTAVEPCRLVPSGTQGKKKAKVRCRCSECGTIDDFWVYNLRSGHSRSCGCYQQEVRSNAHKHLARYRAEREPAWTLGRVRTPTILQRFEIVDARPDETAILQRDEIKVRCRLCNWRGPKEAVELERYPDSCQRCSGKEQWTLAGVRRAIRGKRVLLQADKRTEDRSNGHTKVRLSDRRHFQCAYCGDVKSTTIMSAVRLKTRHCKKCKPDSQWTLGEFRDLVGNLGGTVLGLATEPNEHLIKSRQKIEVQCPYGHTDKKHADHVSNQKTLCVECSTGLYERIVRAHFQAIFGVAFPRARPPWLRNPKTNRSLELDGYAEELKVAFEHDGPHHSGKSIYRGENKNALKAVVVRDALKEERCRTNGVTLIRVPCLGDDLSFRDLRAFILDRCNEWGITPPNPGADAEIATTPDAVRILAEAREIIESRGGKLRSTEYLGAQQPLGVTCAEGHPFSIRVSHLKDKRRRWCRKCYAERLAREGAERHGFGSYRERLAAHLAKQGCLIAAPKQGQIKAATNIVIKCRCGQERPSSGAGAMVLKYHGLCRSCVQRRRHT